MTPSLSVNRLSLAAGKSYRHIKSQLQPVAAVSPGAGGLALTDADLDIDDSLQLLSNERRRLATEYAAQLPAEEVADISAITNYVIDRLEDSEACRTTQYKRVYIAMSQSHLGKLVDAGVLVEANQPGKFMRGPAAEPLADMLANLEEMVE